MGEKTYIITAGDPRVEIAERAKTTVGRFWNFFLRVPLWGGQEWKTMTTEDIAAFFREAARAMVDIKRNECEQAVKEHTEKSWVVRKWLEARGWKAPVIPTEQELLSEIMAKCINLAAWMQETQHRPFYADSDMSAFIVKPRAVAELLRQDAAT